MIALIKTSCKLFVFQFYRMNAGFFLFWFLFFFGIVPPFNLYLYHTQLISFELSSYWMLACVMLCWSLYSRMCIRFFENIIVKYKNSFTHIFQAVDNRNLVVILFTYHVLAFLPVTLYATGMALFAIEKFKIIEAITLWLFLIAIHIYSIYRMRHTLMELKITFRLLLSKFFFWRKWPVDPRLFLFIYLVRERALYVIIIKLFSLFLLYLAFFRIASNAEDFDQSAFMLLLFLISYLHSVLFYQAHKFMEERLAFIRQIPFSFFKLFSLYVIPVALILLPELLFMMINALNVIGPEEVVMYYFFLITQILFFTSLLYLSHFKIYKYLQLLFAIIFLSVFICKAIDIRLFALIQLILSITILKVKYGRYEYVSYHY